MFYLHTLLIVNVLSLLDLYYIILSLLTQITNYWYLNFFWLTFNHYFARYLNDFFYVNNLLNNSLNDYLFLYYNLDRYLNYLRNYDWFLDNNLFLNYYFNRDLNIFSYNCFNRNLNNLSAILYINFDWNLYNSLNFYYFLYFYLYWDLYSPDLLDINWYLIDFLNDYLNWNLKDFALFLCIREGGLQIINFNCFIVILKLDMLLL